MKNLLNIPNAITILRGIILIPLATYFFLINENSLAIGLCGLFFILDIIDGILARKLNKITYFGTIADATVDSLLIASIAITILYLGYITPEVFAIIAAQRITRAIASFYFKTHSNGFYNPISMKIIGWGTTIYVIILPLIVGNFGQTKTNELSLMFAIITYILLLAKIFHGIILLKRKKLKTLSLCLKTPTK